MAVACSAALQRRNPKSRGEWLHSHRVIGIGHAWEGYPVKP